MEGTNRPYAKVNNATLADFKRLSLAEIQKAATPFGKQLQKDVLALIEEEEKLRQTSQAAEEITETQLNDFIQTEEIVFMTKKPKEITYKFSVTLTGVYVVTAGGYHFLYRGKDKAKAIRTFNEA